MDQAKIADFEKNCKNLINEVKISPEIAEIEGVLNEAPAVAASEIGIDYRLIMLNQVANDSQRKVEKNKILAKITEIRKGKLAKVQAIITNAKSKNNDQTTKAELEKVINDLKILMSAAAGSAEKVV
jgi:hypothetical protein